MVELPASSFPQSHRLVVNIIFVNVLLPQDRREELFRCGDARGLGGDGFHGFATLCLPLADERFREGEREFGLETRVHSQLALSFDFVPTHTSRRFCGMRNCRARCLHLLNPYWAVTGRFAGVQRQDGGRE